MTKKAKKVFFLANFIFNHVALEILIAKTVAQFEVTLVVEPLEQSSLTGRLNNVRQYRGKFKKQKTGKLDNSLLKLC